MIALSLELNFICRNTFYFIILQVYLVFTAIGFSNIYQTKVKPTLTNEGHSYVFSNEWHSMNLEILTIQLRHIRNPFNNIILITLFIFFKNTCK